MYVLRKGIYSIYMGRVTNRYVYICSVYYYILRLSRKYSRRISLDFKFQIAMIIRFFLFIFLLMRVNYSLLLYRRYII